jgi:cytochrome c oxidase cbb3-type subunit I/II
MAEHAHRRILEHRGALFAVLTTVAISIGGIVEILPMYSADLGPQALEGVTPYTPLELAGRDIYVREGCYNCHSQMIRPFRAETMRYGEWSRAGEYVYDRPFQLGSRRIGPDLARVGTKGYGDDWHYEHMRDPRKLAPTSIMPPYAWLIDDKYTVEDVTASVNAMRTLGVEYPDDLDVGASIDEQAAGIVGRLDAKGITAEPDDEIIALIAYLQQLGVEGAAAIEGGSE